MDNLICNLLKDYEQGALTRRQLVQRLLVLSVVTSTASASAAGFQASSIDHVSARSARRLRASPARRVRSRLSEYPHSAWESRQYSDRCFPVRESPFVRG